MTEYRIEFQIQRATADGEDFEEIGFGSSGAWDTIDQAVYSLESSVCNGIWETEKGQPDPDDALAAPTRKDDR